MTIDDPTELARAKFDALYAAAIAWLDPRELAMMRSVNARRVQHGLPQHTMSVVLPDPDAEWPALRVVWNDRELLVADAKLLAADVDWASFRAHLALDADEELGDDEINEFLDNEAG
jgi:hypothetical protein